MDQTARRSTAIVSHGTVEAAAREEYGSGPVHLRIGNGGAGATGLIKALALDYLQTLSTPESIHWVCNHSRNTQLALLHDYIDIALTYERDQEDLAAAEGWSETFGVVFHDHFLLAGPVSDPAGAFSCATLEEALSQIARSEAPFHSRADASATMGKERSLWQKLGLAPWERADASSAWYQMSLSSPAEALVDADGAGAYLVTDRSTLMTLTRSRQIFQTTVFFEPTAVDHVLMNSCYALLPSRQSEEKRRNCQSFLSYVLSEDGQRVIGSFGTGEGNQFSSFATVDDGFARSFLRGGHPKNGCWVLPESQG